MYGNIQRGVFDGLGLVRFGFGSAWSGLVWFGP